MLNDIARQYNGKNNGDLVATWKVMQPKGWSSKTTLKKAIDELIYYGFIVMTQQGGISVGEKQRPNLYAVTWQRIDKVAYSDGYSGKSNYKIGDMLGYWSEIKSPIVKKSEKAVPPQARKKMNPSFCTGSGTGNVLQLGKRQ